MLKAAQVILSLKSQFNTKSFVFKIVTLFFNIGISHFNLSVWRALCRFVLWHPFVLCFRKIQGLPSHFAMWAAQFILLETYFYSDLLLHFARNNFLFRRILFHHLICSFFTGDISRNRPRCVYFFLHLI